MKKIVLTVAPLVLLALFACGSSDDGKTGENISDTAASINWVRFDDGLNAAAGNGKHVLAYFWRDG